MQPVVIAAVIVFWLLLSVKVLNEYERAVIFRLGKLLAAPKGPGLIIAAWPIHRARIHRCGSRPARRFPAPRRRRRLASWSSASWICPSSRGRLIQNRGDVLEQL